MNIIELMNVDPDLYMQLTAGLDSMRYSNPDTINKIREKRGEEPLTDEEYKQKLDEYTNYAEAYRKAEKYAKEMYDLE